MVELLREAIRAVLTVNARQNQVLEGGIAIMQQDQTLPIVAICISAFSALLAGFSLLWQLFTWRSMGVRVRVGIDGLYRALPGGTGAPISTPDSYIVRVKNKLRGTATISDVGYEIKETQKGRTYEAAYGTGMPDREELGPKVPVKLESYGSFAWQLPAHYIASQPYDDIEVRGFVVVRGKKKYSKPIKVKPEYLASARSYYGHPMLFDAAFQHRVGTSRPNWFLRKVLRKTGEYGLRPSHPHTDRIDCVL
jgi:hypothetical protein